MKNTLKSIILEDVTILDKKIIEAKDKLEQNFVFNFEWGHAETIYKKTLEKNILSGLLEFIEKEPHRAAEWLTFNIQSLTEELLSGGYTSNSTSVYSNLAHSYKKEVHAILLKTYNNYLKLITKVDKPLDIL